MPTKILSNKGFSLIELVVVMAIITILATIAVPGFRMYKSKATQKEGFSLLNSYFTHAQNARVSYGIYPGNMVGTGFSPAGNLTYRFRTENNPNSQAAIVDPAATVQNDNDIDCIATWSPCDCGVTGCNEYVRRWMEKPAGIIGSRVGPQTVAVACPPLASLGVSDNAFSARVAAVINTNSLGVDRYGIDETKELIMCENGLH